MPLINEGLEIKNVLTGQNKIHIAEAEIYATTSSQWGSMKASRDIVQASHSRAAPSKENGEVIQKSEMPTEIKEVPPEQERNAEKTAATKDDVPLVPGENTNQNDSSTSTENSTVNPSVPFSVLNENNNSNLTGSRDEETSTLGDPREPIFA